MVNSGNIAWQAALWLLAALLPMLAQTFDELKAKAESGNAEAQLMLGSMLANGEGVPQSFEEAAKWFRKSADQNNAEAQFALSLMHVNGDGVKQDFGEAVNWAKKAAEQGHPLAQINLAIAYRSGTGIATNLAEAAKWFKKAAEQGVSDAQFNLGIMYWMGEGVAKDTTNAFKWLNLAAEQGNEMALRAKTALTNLIATEEKLQESSEAIFGKIIEAAEMGDAEAQNTLGYAHLTGEGVPVDYNVASNWLAKAAAQRHLEASIHLASMHANGVGMPTNLVQAWVILTRAAESNALAREFRRQIVSRMTAEQLNAAGGALNQTNSPVAAQPQVAKTTPAPAPPSTAPAPAPPAPKPPTIEELVAKDLKLKGLSSGTNTKMALINDKSLGPQEEASIKLGDRSVKVKVLEITDAGVLLQIEGMKEPKRLQLASTSK